MTDSTDTLLPPYAVASTADWRRYRRWVFMSRILLWCFYVPMVLCAVVVLFVIPPVDLVLAAIFAIVLLPLRWARNRAMSAAQYCVESGKCPECFGERAIDGPVRHRSHCIVERHLRKRGSQAASRT